MLLRGIEFTEFANDCVSLIIAIKEARRERITPTMPLALFAI